MSLRRFSSVLAVLGLVASACKGPGSTRPEPDTHLESSFFFAERDARGGEHAISAKPGGKTTGVERTADGATLDVNSQLQVRIEDALATPSRPGTIVAPAQAAALAADVTALTTALANIAVLDELQTEAIRAWELYSADPAADDASPSYQQFDRAKRALAKAELDVLDPIRRLWPMAKRTEVDTLVTNMLTGTPDGRVKLAGELQKKVDELAQRGEDLARSVRARGEADQRRLRIEAFLIPSEGAEKSHAVHVPGYDHLDEGKVQRIDPLGLRLSGVERKALEDLMASSRDLARAVERVRRGEATLAQAFEESGNAMLQGLVQLVDDLEQLDVPHLTARAQRTREAFQSFVAELERLAAELVQGKRAEWEQELASLLTGTGPIADLAAEIDAIVQLREDWKHVTTESLPDLVTRTLAAIRKLERAWDDRAALVDEAKQLLANLDKAVAGLAGDARTKAELAWSQSKLRGELEELKQLVGRIDQLLTKLAGAVGLDRKPVRTNIQNPDVIDIPIGEARDSAIDLRRTTRKSGDSLQVRARLLAPGTGDEDAEPPLEVTFELEKLGWHADLIPSVVFVEGDQVAGADDSGGFSAALNWMWSYGPRDDEDDPYLSRMLGWGVGLHAVFLNFGPDNDAEIGLGVTASLWHQYLQFGVGYNPMAESDEDGRVYYFLGSSLIPLLQALTPDE